MASNQHLPQRGQTWGPRPEPYGQQRGSAYDPQQIHTMPRSVRRAQYSAWALSALTLVSALYAATRAHQDASSIGHAFGYAVGLNVFCLVLTVLAFFFRRGGPALRWTTLGVAALAVIASIGSIAGRGTEHTHTYAHGIVIGAVIIALLCRPDAVAWFSRPRDKH
ncbi:hypothetical protein ACQB60_44960 [Actinomycetota bacterium Odt1-20B]